MATASPELVHVTIVRDAGMLGSGPSAKLSINGADVAKLRTSERLDIYLKPGSYIFGVEPSPRLMGALVESSFDLAKGKQYVFRISVSTGGSLVFQPSARLE